MASTYRDINLTLQKHPGTKDILKKNDIEAVKASIKNIIFGKPFDIPFDPHYGMNIRGYLMETITPSLIALMKKQLTLKITEYDPRCIIEDLYVDESPYDPNALNVGILFHVDGNPEQQTLSLTMQRVR